jgi:dUTP pyrophosphatase
MVNGVTVVYKVLPGRNAKIPQRGTDGSAYYDVYTDETYEMDIGEVHLYGTGLVMYVNEDYFIDIRPRSGLSSKGICVANAPGTVDSDYRDELKIIMMNHSNKRYTIKAGDRIAQMSVMPVQLLRFRETIVGKAYNTKKHEGWGSTGR